MLAMLLVLALRLSVLASQRHAAMVAAVVRFSILFVLAIPSLLAGACCSYACCFNPCFSTAHNAVSAPHAVVPDAVVLVSIYDAVLPSIHAATVCYTINVCYA